MQGAFRVFWTGRNVAPRARRDILGFTAFVVAAVAALAFSIAIGDRSPTLAVAGGFIVAIGIWLAASQRYTLTLGFLMLYIGLVDGYLKLRFDSSVFVLIRDALLYAIVAGATWRWAVQRTRLVLPPLSGWVIAWVTVVVLELFNPANGTASHSIQALRPHLEFVPLFFLAYFVMRTPARLRGFLTLLVLVAAINGVVATIQFSLTPEQLASWGPGYEARISGVGVSGRAFVDNGGITRVRPFGLGSDIGFAGALGGLACGAGIALLYRRRSTAMLLPISAAIAATALAVVTSQARVAILGASVTILVFLVLVSGSRKRLNTLVAASVVAVLVFTVVNTLVGRSDVGSFDRYSSIAPSKILDTTYTYRKDTLAKIPAYASDFPLGAGLGTVGPGSGIAGGNDRDLNAESQYTFLLVETGIAGLIVMLGFNLALLVVICRRLRRVQPRELRILLAALAAPLFALVASWVVGATTASTPGSAYMWFAAGTLVFWLYPSVARERAEDAISQSPGVQRGVVEAGHPNGGSRG